MPRVRKSASERLNDSINVPVNRTLKRRVIRVAKQMPGQPSHTKLSRAYIEKCVSEDERTLPVVVDQVQSTREAAPAAN